MSEPNDSNTGNDSDQDFDPSAEMMVNDFDDEHTLDEEEAELNDEDKEDEINALNEEQDMPIEELLARYYPNAATAAAADDDDQNNPQQQSTSQAGLANSSSGSSRTTATAAAAAASAARSGFAAPGSTAPLSDYESDESDDEFSANEDEWRRVIQVGTDYQAAIPEWTASPNTLVIDKYEGDEEAAEEQTMTRTATRFAGENRDYLLWKPPTQAEIARMCSISAKTPLEALEAKLNQVLDEYVRAYDAMFDEELAAVAAANAAAAAAAANNAAGTTPTTLPSGEHSRDDDHALYLLFKCGYSVAEALAAYERAPALAESSSPVRKMMEPWTEEECRAFETGLRTYGKDFFTIKREKIGSRSVGEVITFYYFWKKTERHDQFVAKYRIEKKKYALHPGTTDYMDRFVDEQENMGSMAASSSASLLHSAHNQQHLTPNNAASALMNLQQQQQQHSHHSTHNNSSSHSLLQSNAASNFHLNPNARGSGGAGGGHHQYQSNVHHTSYQSNRPGRGDRGQEASGTSMLTVNTAGVMRTINVSGSGETQTILINDGDFNGSAGGGDGRNSSSRSAGQSSRSSSSHLHPQATIVVGKNAVVIDGDQWVANSSGGSPTSPTSLSTPSVSIYKLPSGTSSGGQQHHRSQH